MIHGLIQQAKRFGHKAGENWIGMIHDDPTLERMGEDLHKNIDAYRDNMKTLLEQCELAFISVSSSEDATERQDALHQCIAWLRGEIKELEQM